MLTARRTTRAMIVPVGATRFRGICFLLLAGLLLAGCSRFKLEKHEYVYVSARQVYLHDRVAAVSNRVGMVTNGEALEVVERGKRFLKVKTPKGEIGWLEDHAIIDDKLYAQYQELAKAHSKDLVVATAELRDDLYLHVLPGRETPHFLLIPGNAKVELLARGTVEKASAPGMGVGVRPKVAAAPNAAGGNEASSTPGKVSGQASVPVAKSLLGQEKAGGAVAAPLPPPPPMEDWWLVRDKNGNTGWLIAGRLDVDVPDEVGAYAEGQRMVGAYPIAKVMDYEGGAGLRERGRAAKERGKKAAEAAAKAEGDAAAEAPAPKEMTEYVTVLTPPRNGLPYDFDQIRVFTWSLNHHRYETGYRLHGIQGYLPVRISQETVTNPRGGPSGTQTYPVFSFQIANGPNVSIDPDTGVTRPVNPRTVSFRLEGNLVRRTGADQAPIILTHEGEEPGKAKAGAKKKKR